MFNSLGEYLLFVVVWWFIGVTVIMCKGHHRVWKMKVWEFFVLFFSGFIGAFAFLDVFYDEELKSKPENGLRSV